MSQGDGEVLTELSPENSPLPTGFIHGRQRQARGDLHLEKCVQLFPRGPHPEDPTHPASDPSASPTCLQREADLEWLVG